MFPMKLSVSLKSTVTTHKFPIILHSAGSHCALQGAHSRRGQSMYRKSKKAGVQSSCHRTRAVLHACQMLSHTGCRPAI
jgi:hypothetical protein